MGVVKKKNQHTTVGTTRSFPHLFLSPHTTTKLTKASPNRGNGRRILPALGHVGKPVEQRGPRHAHAVKPNLPIVHAVEPHLGVQIFDAHARRQAPRVVPDADDEDVGAALDAANRQLSKHGRHFAVLPRAANPEFGR